MQDNQSSKKAIIGLRKFLIALFLILFLVITSVVVYDPYFHYHAPIKGLYYTLYDQRYQNDGIIKHFDYDAIIVGSSMTENFRTSEADKLFEANFIKVPSAGATMYELSNNVRTAFEYNDDIKIIIQSIDYNRLFDVATAKSTDGEYDYLYDNNPFNDGPYVLSKEVLLVGVKRALSQIIQKEKTDLNFDNYSYWGDKFEYGKQMVDDRYARNTLSMPEEQEKLSDEERETIKENIQSNLIDIATAHPETVFYYYYTPYSIADMDLYNFYGWLGKRMEAEKYITELLLPYDNIHLYSFYGETDIITDINNFKDIEHHTPEVNSLILQWIHDGYSELTAENYVEFYEKEWDFYMNFDYETYFADWD